MREILAILLRIAGAGLILLAVLHIPIGKHLKWREDASRLTPVNASIFHVHTFFICVVLVMMGLPCLIDPQVFLESSRAGAWLAWSFSGFWTIRLYFPVVCLPCGVLARQAIGNYSALVVQHGVDEPGHTFRSLRIMAGRMASLGLLSLGNGSCPVPDQRKKRCI